MENQVLDAIFNRRSIRRYTDQPVSSDQLDLILKAGQAAPSAMNQQPWYFVAIQRKDMIEQLASLLTENEDPYYNAPLLIVVFADKKAYSPVTDAALAIANMMLAAQALQLGTCWMITAGTCSIIRSLPDYPPRWACRRTISASVRWSWAPRQNSRKRIRSSRKR